MARNNNIDTTTQFFLNPLVHLILFLLFIIILLAIFKVQTPALTAGVSAKAHIGDFKGEFNIETFDNNDNQALFVMYYATWCGHCKNTMPEFDKLMSNPPKGVKVMKIDSDDSQYKDLLKSQNVQGFPTIRLYPKGLNSNYVDYNGERTYGGFMNFFKSSHN